MQKEKPASRRRVVVFLILALLVIAVLLWISAYHQVPKIFEDVAAEDIVLEPYPLTDIQEQTLRQRGQPDGFTILFYEDNDADGELTVMRQETWSYYAQNVDVVFLNGELVLEDPMEYEGSEVSPIPYRPEQFTAFMSLEEVIAAAGLEQYLVVPLEDEIVDDAEVYYAPELTFGLQDGELVYVEALPAVAEVE
jgi:hypothetical protein